jgi:hypothetical protein
MMTDFQFRIPHSTHLKSAIWNQMAECRAFSAHRFASDSPGLTAGPIHYRALNISSSDQLGVLRQSLGSCPHRKLRNQRFLG